MHNDLINDLLIKDNNLDILKDLMDDLNDGLKDYHDIACNVLNKSCVKIKKYDSNYLSLEKNYFSMIFLYSFYRLDIPKNRRILYVTINQCLRGMVTGCDNIFDDEYKKTLDTDLPEKGYKFRSILDIMASDRILFSVLLKSAENGGIDYEMVEPAVNESLRSLLKSGVQEASEEEGVDEFLTPETILTKVHHYKTGVLFQSPLAIPAIIEKNNGEISRIKDALYDIGMGCQILDDMVDISMDIHMKRHNYVSSLIFHSGEKEQMLHDIEDGNIDRSDDNYLKKFPKALELLNKGFDNLFKEEHGYMKSFSIDFISKQIGAQKYIGDKIE